MNDFDFEGVFNEDYLYFYEQILTPERTAEDVERFVELLELSRGQRSSTVRAVTAASRTRSRSAASVSPASTRATSSSSVRVRTPTRAASRSTTRRATCAVSRGSDRFDALVNWFTSFGYFSDAQNKAVLREFHGALKPGGR